MANALTGGYGLRPIGITGGNPNSAGITQYEIASNYTTAIYQGGIVIPLAAGTIAISDQAVARLVCLMAVSTLTRPLAKWSSATTGRARTTRMLTPTIR